MLRSAMGQEFSHEIYTKPLGERARKVLLVYGAELDTMGAREEGEANFNREY